MDSELNYSGVEIDLATCSDCGFQEIFETPIRLKYLIGGRPPNRWVCAVENTDEAVETFVACPDCGIDSEFTFEQLYVL